MVEITNDLKLILLLHDIGIFYQRTGISPSGEYKDFSEKELGNKGIHSKWSASLAEELGLSKAIQKVILYHHKPEALSEGNAIIAQILNKASFFFIDKENVSALPLLSVFSEIKISENNVPQNYFLPIQKLDINNFRFPIKEDEANNKEAYERLWNDFKKELKKASADRLPDNLYYLIKKYTSLIPSASKDISLFDHIKITTVE